MPALASYKALLVWLLLAWLSPLTVQAACCAANIEQAELVQHGDHYQLSADISYPFSDRALEALQNGVPLFWDLQIKLQQPRAFLWAKTLVATTLRYRLQYHALLNMYRVKNETSGEVYNFSTLSAALGLMSVLRDFQIAANADLAGRQPVVVAIKVDFDRNALPLPLRPFAYLSRQWYLSSDWTVWPLKN
jgi:hypothetical protein